MRNISLSTQMEAFMGTYSFVFQKMFLGTDIPNQVFWNVIPTLMFRKMIPKPMHWNEIPTRVLWNEIPLAHCRNCPMKFQRKYFGMRFPWPMVGIVHYL